MARDHRSNRFADHLGGQGLREVDIAVALLWFETHDNPEAEFSARELASLMRDLRIRGNVNSTRLGQSLARHKDVVRARNLGTFRIRAGRGANFQERFSEFRRTDNLPVDENLLPMSTSLGSRTYLESLRREINGAYQYGFYNSCAVMCRRIVEILLIEAIVKAGKSSLIENANGDYKMLADIIGVAKDKNVLRLSRNAPKALDAVKARGDPAAHHRHYITSKHDIDELNPMFRQLISELVVLAGIA